ncbi:hypothetical protein [Streptomyces chrestomyceticus]|uniref:hypothetical protein n=1 Tax=Streptomyces chrestomyceticus TaxID=68185 RepID=UPI00379F55C9
MTGLPDTANAGAAVANAPLATAAAATAVSHALRERIFSIFPFPEMADEARSDVHALPRFRAARRTVRLRTEDREAVRHCVKTAGRPFCTGTGWFSGGQSRRDFDGELPDGLETASITSDGGVLLNRRSESDDYLGKFRD